jgi:hypothetical protein
VVDFGYSYEVAKVISTEYALVKHGSCFWSILKGYIIEEDLWIFLRLKSYLIYIY